MHLKKSVKIGENELSIETGRLAKQADGAVVVQYGDTMLLVTAVSAKEKKDVDFLPLTVEYQEKLYAAGRIPGSYFKREGRLTEKETLTSRLVDRSCRPLFPEGYAYETQVIAGVISADSENEGDSNGITGASGARWWALSTTPCATGATMSQMKSLCGPGLTVTFAATAREKYFSAKDCMRPTAWSRSESPIST
jgi:polyribonucleotide nucleotidyltransferase